MRWNLRMVAAQRGVWRASDLRRALAAAGLELSVGKMSRLWSQRPPVSIRLADLEIICRVLECSPSDLMVLEAPASEEKATMKIGDTQRRRESSVIPKSRAAKRSLPPV